PATYLRSLHDALPIYGASVFVVNRDDAQVVALTQGLQQPDVRSFGRGLPELEGDFGLDEDLGMDWLAAVPMSEPDLASSRRKSRDRKSTRLNSSHVKI